MWVARDKGGDLALYKEKPMRDLSGYGWISLNSYNSLRIDNTLFPEVTYKEEPVEVNLTIFKNGSKNL